MSFANRWRHLPRGEYAFPGPLRDRLVSAIVAGEKTTTSSLLIEYEHDDEPLPQVGHREVIVDSAGEPVAVTEVTGVWVIRLADVDLAHARDEGEGFTTVRAWRIGHEAFWHSVEYRAAIDDPGFHVDDDTAVVCERFRLIDVS